MCGIAGIVALDGRHPPPSREALTDMIAAVRHRGPDAFGIYRDARAGLAHARLSIIDLSSGDQPMGTGDGRLWVVFNGEIFNYVELRGELEQLGHGFRTRSDTEVILHAWECWGADCFGRFNGQWAIALWDAVRRTLVLARDRVGVRPLYVHHRDGVLRFASEVKSLFADPAVRRAFDLRGLDQLFTYWAPLAPTTVFDGVEEVRPGSVRIYDDSGLCSEQIIWRPEFPHDGAAAFPLSVEEAAEELRAKLRTATRLRITRADVPVGSYLSGGLDSSVIARLGREAKEGEFRTFSIRFEDAEFDETPYQRMMAAQLDSRHEEVLVRRSDIARVFPDVVRHAERPLLRSAAAPMFLLSGLVRSAGFKAVLTGEGADEFLAGYDLFREAAVRRFWARDPESRLRPRLMDRLYPYLARSPQQARGMALQFWKKGLEAPDAPGFSHGPRWSSTAALKRFFTPAAAASLAAAPAADVLAELPPAFGSWDPLARAQYLEIVTLLSGYLLSSQGDRMLMAHSVEGRFPFLDADVMEFCLSLPADYKLRILDEKHLLKRAARGMVPEPIIGRPKQPYRAPDAASFAAPDAPEYVREVLSERSVLQAGVFQPAAVSALHDKIRARAAGGDTQFSNADNMAFLGVLSTQLLHDTLLRPAGAPDQTVHTFTVDVDRTMTHA